MNNKTFSKKQTVNILNKLNSNFKKTQNKEIVNKIIVRGPDKNSSVIRRHIESEFPKKDTKKKCGYKKKSQSVNCVARTYHRKRANILNISLFSLEKKRHVSA